jgi:choline dehydrogenase-like flavoprotein
VFRTRVFDASNGGERPFHEGLYIADAARLPTSLGVNPSLTIAALALHTADKIIEELRAVSSPLAPPTSGVGAPTAPAGA